LSEVGVDGGNRSSTAVKSIERALLLLEAFTVERPQQSLKELSAFGRLPKSTTHRALTALIRGGLIEPGRTQGTYRLSLRAASLGAVALSAFRPEEEVGRLLKDLRDKTGETIGLSVLQGRDALVIDRVHSLHSLSANVRIGSLLPGHATSAGRVLLAELTRDQLDREMTGLTELPAYTARTPTSVAQLHDVLAVVQAQQYAIDDCEYADGLRCVAVPVRDSDNRCAYALGLSASATRVDVSQLRDLAGYLTAAAVQMTPLIPLLEAQRR
jgi:DNA-binding IclR family transcriptional regulator